MILRVKLHLIGLDFLYLFLTMGLGWLLVIQTMPTQKANFVDMHVYFRLSQLVFWIQQVLPQLLVLLALLLQCLLAVAHKGKSSLMELSSSLLAWVSSVSARFLLSKTSMRNGMKNILLTFGAVHGVRQMETTVRLSEQISEPGDSTNSVRTTITFDQSISYIELDSSVPAQELISIPFLNVDEKQRYGELLADNIGAFSDVQFPINRPVLSVSGDMDPSSDSISTGAIVGIAVGAIVGIALAAYLAYFLVRGRHNNINTGRNENGDSPVVAADISPPNDEVVSEPATVIAVPYLPDYKDQVRSVVPNGTLRTNTQLPAGPSYKQGEQSSNYQGREDP